MPVAAQAYSANTIRTSLNTSPSLLGRITPVAMPSVMNAHDASSAAPLLHQTPHAAWLPHGEEMHDMSAAALQCCALVDTHPCSSPNTVRPGVSTTERSSWLQLLPSGRAYDAHSQSQPAATFGTSPIQVSCKLFPSTGLKTCSATVSPSRTALPKCSSTAALDHVGPRSTHEVFSEEISFAAGFQSFTTTSASLNPRSKSVERHQSHCRPNVTFPAIEVFSYNT
jgi:hypothetical protein